jgi:hypothetical protein
MNGELVNRKMFREYLAKQGLRTENEIETLLHNSEIVIQCIAKAIRPRGMQGVYI